MSAQQYSVTLLATAKINFLLSTICFNTIYLVCHWRGPNHKSWLRHCINSHEKRV